MLGCEYDNEKVWGDLKGQELSAYVSGPLKTQSLSTFAWHLKNHGTQEDFSCWIEKHSKPFVMACEMFLNAPDFAKSWLIEFLDNTSDSDMHHKVLTNLGYHAKFSHGVSPQALEVLQHIKYDCIKSEDISSSLQVLLQARSVDLLEKNWSVFEHAAKNLGSKLLIYAASLGWDLYDKLNVEPSKPDQYFVMCCIGGLLNRVKQYAVAPSEVETIHQAFAQTALHQNDQQKMNDVLHHLWDTYTNQPWETSEDNAAALMHGDIALVQKFATHHHRHDPEKFRKQAEGFSCHAIYEKKYTLLDVLLPYIDSNDYHKVFYNAVYNKRKKALKTLWNFCTENTIGHEGFFEALKKCGKKETSWANEVYAAHQKEILHVKIATHRKNAPSTTRTKKL